MFNPTRDHTVPFRQKIHILPQHHPNKLLLHGPQPEMSRDSDTMCASQIAEK